MSAPGTNHCWTEPWLHHTVNGNCRSKLLKEQRTLGGNLGTVWLDLKYLLLKYSQVIVFISRLQYLVFTFSRFKLQNNAPDILNSYAFSSNLTHAHHNCML